MGFVGVVSEDLLPGGRFAVDIVAGVVAWAKGLLAIPIKRFRRHQAAESQDKCHGDNHFEKM